MLKPGVKAPNINIELVNGAHWELQDQNPREFTMIVFYRGKHCPVCKKYLQELQEKLQEFVKRGVNIIAISADNKERAVKTYDDWTVGDLPIGYGFNIDEAREWGLYISEGIKDEPKHFIEPGVFLIKQNGELYSAHIQSMPFARPEFDDMLKAIDYILKEEYPARGEA